MKNRSPIPPELQDEIRAMDPREGEQLTRIWELLDVARPDSEPDVDAGWKAINADMGESREYPEHAGRRDAGRMVPMGRLRRVSLPTVYRYAVAACVVVLFAAGAIGVSPSRFVAEPGAQRRVALNDGSTVTLNSDSRLVTAGPIVRLLRPSAERRVSLEGEAYFDVASGDSPFTVETFNARVEVLGTEFDVRAYRDGFGDATEVVVTEGNVRLSPIADVDRQGAAVTLGAGQSSRVEDGAETPSEAQEPDLEAALAWQTRGFSLVERPLGVVFAEIERRYDIEIDIRGELDLTRLKTLHYSSARSAESILLDLGQSEGFQYRRTLRGYEIVAD